MAATDQEIQRIMTRCCRTMVWTGMLSIALVLLLISYPTLSAVLPEDRADALYHSYNGGGVEVTGPSYLIRKGDDKRFSGSINYYADSITSASVDVITQGSPYNESRTQWSGSLDYMNADTTMTLSYGNSDESDYTADTYSFSVSQSMFGQLTTISLGYSYGNDDITSNVNPDLDQDAEHKNYHISLTQILTKNLLLSMNYDGVTDQGYLQNPYRNVLVLNDPNDPSAGANFNTPENYPRTRTSNAMSASILYYLPYRASMKLFYRYYTDDWDIDAHTAQISYTHPWRDRWIFDASFRYYEQTDADFYADLFSFPNQQNFMARDKELSEFKDYTAGFGVTYNVFKQGWGHIDKATINFRYDRIWFDYDNFTDVKNGTIPEQGPAYDFTADVIQVFASIWY